MEDVPISGGINRVISDGVVPPQVHFPALLYEGSSVPAE